MPAPPPIAYANISQAIPATPYILSITPSLSSPHLLLRHPTSELSIADAQTLRQVDQLRGGHSGLITDVQADQTAIWTSGKDACIVRWDERSRRVASTIKAFLRRPLPVLSLAVSERNNLVIGGTELVSSESHILFWDTRNTQQPAYSHNSTHSDDITHLSLLPSTSTFLAGSSSTPIPARLLLSASTDGLVALSSLQETDEDEAVLAADNWGQSIASAGAYEVSKGKLAIWGRSDMDAVARWEVGRGEEGELELQNHMEDPSSSFRSKTFTPPHLGPSTTQTASEEREDKSKLVSDYLIDVVPSLGVGRKGGPMVASGTNEGDIILQYQSSSTGEYQPSGYFVSGPGPSRGHKDVVRSIYHDVQNEAVYTGSEDGVLSGWSLSALSSRLQIGDPEIDDDGGDGREGVMSDDEDDEQDSDESEIETDESDQMEIDDEGPRYGPVLTGRGGDKRKEKRKEARFGPY
ncbi:WD repeat-containing protein 89, partial [Tremellales sp. Uapishka_1]